MSRRKSGELDSTDLLLDTITNAFGGIVFMALLLAILVRVSQSPSDDQHATSSSSLESLKAQQEYEMLQAERDSLTASISAMNDSSLKMSPDDQREFERLRELQKQFSDAQGQLATVRQKVAEMDQETAEIAASKEKLQILADQLRGEVEELEELVADEKEKRTITSELPIERATIKSQVAILVRRHRLVAAFSDIGVNIELKPCSSKQADFFESAKREYFRVTENSGAATTSESEVSQALQGVDSANEFLGIAIWEDSFEDFELVRREIVRRGLDYQLMLMKDGEIIRTGGGGSARVQ